MGEGKLLRLDLRALRRVDFVFSARFGEAPLRLPFTGFVACFSVVANARSLPDSVVY